MSIYEVRAQREGAWWVITVPELDILTQCRRLDQVRATAVDLISLWLDVPDDAVNLNITTVLDPDVRQGAEQVKELQAKAEKSASTAAGAARNFAAQLLDRGYTVRDAGAILGVSAQRVSQLTAGHSKVVLRARLKSSRGKS